jgi:hypothetical protein
LGGKPPPPIQLIEFDQLLIINDAGCTPSHGAAVNWEQKPVHSTGKLKRIILNYHGSVVKKREGKKYCRTPRDRQILVVRERAKGASGERKCGVDERIWRAKDV